MFTDIINWAIAQGPTIFTIIAVALVLMHSNEDAR